jgi:hypothetical protein
VPTFRNAYCFHLQGDHIRFRRAIGRKKYVDNIGMLQALCPVRGMGREDGLDFIPTQSDFGAITYHLPCEPTKTRTLRIT